MTSFKKNAEADLVRPYISPLVEGAGTLAGAALEFMVLPAGGILAATLGLASAVAGVWIQEGVLPENIVELQEKGLIPRFPSRIWQKIKLQAEQKLNYDFDNSAISSNQNLRLCRIYSRKAMVDAGLIREDDERFPNDCIVNELGIREASYLGQVQDEDLKILGGCGHLAISCTAAPVAFIAVLRKVASDCHERFGLDLEIEFKYPYGPDQIKDLNELDRYDFILAVDAPFFMAGRSRAKKYRLLFPIHWDANFAVKKKHTKTITTEILFCPDSSAHEASRVNPEIRAKKRSYVSFSDLSKLVHELDSGQSVLAWDPIASTLARLLQLQNLSTSPETTYRPT